MIAFLGYQPTGWLASLLIGATVLLADAAARQPEAKAEERTTALQVPLRFEPNRGQTSTEVKFLARADHATLLVKPHGIQVRMGDTSALQMEFVGAGYSTHLEGNEPTNGRAHYYLGTDPSSWLRDIPLYQVVRARDLYPGIDLLYYGGSLDPSGGRPLLEYDLVVQPGADPDRIHILLRGLDAAELLPNGDLEIRLDEGKFRLRRPSCYQEIDGRRHAIEGAFQLLPGRANGQAELTFHTGSYDRTRKLFIDPVFGYSTYLGGSTGSNASGNDDGNGIAVDASGRAHIVGRAESVNFPTRNPADGTLNNGPGSSQRRDAFITKLTADGSDIEFSTYLGGRDLDVGFSISLDGAGNVYAAGRTASTDFPTTRGALRETDPDGSAALDGILVKLSPAGALLYSTYVGGSNYDICHGISAVDDRDSSGRFLRSHVLITGETRSTDFPQRNAYQSDYGGGSIDCFVLCLNPDSGDATSGPTDPDDLVYGTYIGGQGDDSGYGLRADTEGRALVTGITASNSFPTTHDALDGSLDGLTDAFVIQIDPTQAGAASLNYGTYLGGSKNELGYGITTGVDKRVYVAGETNSANFPTTAGAFDRQLGGTSDAFVVKLDLTQAPTSQLGYATLIGGSSGDWARQIVVSSAGTAFIAGGTSSSNFPRVEALQNDQPGQDGWAARLNSTGTSLLFSTYLGGSGMDEARSIGLDGSRNAYLTGETNSRNFPTTPGAFDRSYGAAGDCWVTKIGFPEADYALSASPSTITPAGTIHVTWTAPSGRPTSDRISLFSLGAPNSSPITSHLTGGTTSGSLNLTAPTNAGSYECRYLLGGTHTDVARSSLITVQPPPSEGLLFRAATSNNNGNGNTTLTLSRPGGIQSGDLLLAAVAVGRTNVNLTPPSGWTLIIGAAEGSEIRTMVYRRLANGTEPASYDWKFSGSAPGVGALLVYRGADRTQPIDTADGLGNARSTSITSPSIRTGRPGVVLLQVAATSVATGITPASGMTEQVEATGTGLTLSVSEQPRPTPGATGTRVAIAAQAARNVGHAVALRPSSSP